MEYKRNLRKDIKKSKLSLILGIVVILFIPVYFLYEIFTKGADYFHFTNPFFLITYSLIYGLFFIKMGLGYSIGKSFVLINDDVINIKLGFLIKEHLVYWRDIQSIDYKPNSFKINKKDNTLSLISIAVVDYSGILKIKKVIAEIAESKGIPSTFFPPVKFTD